MHSWISAGSLLSVNLDGVSAGGAETWSVTRQSSSAKQSGWHVKHRISVWPCCALGKGVLLGRVGGTKSDDFAWSRGGLEGPGVTGVEEVVMIVAISTVAVPSSSPPRLWRSNDISLCR